MLKDRLKKLFEHCDPAIQAIISSVLSMEQEYISMERPRVKDEVDSIISLVANKKPGRAGTGKPTE